MRIINNWPTLVSKFQGFSFTNDNNDYVEKTASSTMSKNCWYRWISGRGPKELSACSRQSPRSIPQVAAFTSSSISFFAKDCVWILLYDVKKELIINSNSSK